MRKERYVPGMSGRIAAWLVDKRTGARKLVARHSNVITYGAADVMARLAGGDSSYAPNGIGFIYAEDGSTLPAPDPDEREYTISDLSGEISGVAGNALFCDLNPPKYQSSNADRYTGNEVGFLSLSDLAGGSRMFSGGAFDPDPPSPGVDYFWRVMLLNRRYVNGSLTPVYTLFAYTTILEDTGTGVDIDENLGLLVEWPISFM